jgi:hypothetical protein
MSKSATSIFYFGIYVLLTGIQLTFIPNIFLGVIKQPETSEPWIRVVGIIALALSYYYIVSARKENTEFFKLTIPARIFFFIGMSALVVLGIGPAIFIGLGLVDLVAAIWTWQSMKGEGKI